MPPRHNARVSATPENPRPRPAPGTPLYVHLPFCAAKCPYCDFFSVAAEGQDTASVIDLVLREAETWAPEAPRTVFLGGGTPSIHTPEELERLLNGLDDLSGFRAAATEVTAECNPESLDLEKASCLLALGVDRLSIGFQSLRQETLELFGRVHDVDQAFHAFEAARAAGVQRLNVDLIYAAPGQDLASWDTDLRRVLALGPDHLSAYNLTYEEGTLFTRWLAEGRLTEAPEELALELFQHTRRLCAEHGLGAYEISNFSSNGQECRHNLNYWRNGPYAALGPSAVSKIGPTRRGRPRTIPLWRAAVEGRGEAWAFEETLDPLARLGETWWLGLRLATGVDPVRAREAAGWVPPEPGAPEDPALATASRLADQGLLTPPTDPGGTWSLSETGLPLADAVGREFLVLSSEAPA